MENVYPVIKKDIIVRTNPAKEIKFITKAKTISVTHQAWEVLQRCHGTKTIYQITDELKQNWDISIDEVTKFILEAEKNEIIFYSHDYNESPIIVTGDTKCYYPEAVLFVLTNKCNLKCSYCYGDYNPSNKDFMDLGKIEWLMPLLKSKGVSHIELSGGEPLIHPHFKKILKISFENFSSVAILSNGVLFDDELFSTIIQHKDQIALQISIDGCTAEVNSLVRGVRNTWNKSLKTIQKLIENNIKIRVGYIITKENMHELKNTLELMKKIGVKHFVFTPVNGLGRGINLKYSNNCSLINMHSKSDDFSEMLKIVKEANELYRDILVISQVKNTKPDLLNHTNFNCGIGHQTISIYPDGDIYGCQLVGKYGPRLGNIFTEEMPSIFNNSVTTFFREFKQSTDETACKECEYFGYCQACLTRIYIANNDRRSKGNDLCPVVLKSGMDKIFDFNNGFEWSL
jgi:radical SAM protein with 4Fe4S-binding SPASM domain